MMRNTSFFQYRNAIALVLLVGLIYSCGRPARKKLPDINSVGFWEYAAAPYREGLSATADLPPFYTGDTSLTIQGRTLDLLTIALPDPGHDSLAIRLADAYAPFAAGLIDQVMKQGYRGVLIDLRNDEEFRGDGDNTTHRADFSVVKEGEGSPVSLPLLVLLWDPAFTGRAQAFIRALQSLPGYQSTRTGGNDDDRKAALSNCFSPDRPQSF